MSRKFALFIGNNEYEDLTLSKLKTPASDVQALAGIMRDPAVGEFDEVVELINQSETNVRRAISQFFASKKPEDLLLLYFSGHGVLDDQGRLFLAVKDTQRNLLKATAIPTHFITSEMDDCRSKRQILILDCCHSGAFVHGGKGQASVNETTFKGNGYGRVVLTASNSTQYAFEGDQVIKQAELSLFSHYLLEGLVTGEADADGNGLISLDDWYDYAYGKIVHQTPMQTPQKWTYSQQGDLIIAKNPRPKTIEPATLPMELLQTIESPFASVRAGAVQELGRMLKGSDKALSLAARETLEKMADDDSRQVQSLAAKFLAEQEAQTPETPRRESYNNVLVAQFVEKPGSGMADKSQSDIGKVKQKDNAPLPDASVSKPKLILQSLRWKLSPNWSLRNGIGWVIAMLGLTILLNSAHFRAVTYYDSDFELDNNVRIVYVEALAPIASLWLIGVLFLALLRLIRKNRCHAGWWTLFCGFGGCVGCGAGFMLMSEDWVPFGGFTGVFGGLITGLVTWRNRPKDLFESQWKRSILFGWFVNAVVGLLVAMTRLSVDSPRSHISGRSINTHFFEWIFSGAFGGSLGGVITGIILILWLRSYEKMAMTRQVS